MTIIELRGGLLVQESALALALDLEARGHALTAKDGVLYAANGTALTAEDRAAIKRQRLQLLAIASYEAPQ